MTDPTKTPTAINQRNIRSFAFETEPPAPIPLAGFTITITDPVINAQLYEALRAS